MEVFPSPTSVKTRGKVLVVGDDARSFLAVVRSLGRRGIEVHVVPIIRGTPALTSRYIAAFHRLPYHEGSGTLWVQQTRQLLDREKFDLVIPLDDRSIIPFHLHREAFREHRIALPSALAFEVMFSKEQTRELAKSLGIRVARGRVSRLDDTAQSIVDEFGLPVILKPPSSFSPEKLYEKSVVRRADTRDHLETHLATQFRSGDFIIEAAFSGIGLGVSILARKGEILQAFEHHRVHEPMGGGGSSYRVSAPIQADLLNACGKFIASLDYTGVAMFEYKQDPDTRDWILLEVNGRFWGSLPLAVAAGVDFPSLLYDLLVDERTYDQPFYRYGVYSRSIGDDYWYYRFKLSESLRKRRGLGSLLVSTAAELGHVFQGVERIDTLALDDLRPAYHDVASLFSQPFERLSRAALRRTPFFRRKERRRIARAVCPPAMPEQWRLLFVCKGNICRSPFAAAVAKRLIPTAVVMSAGTLPLSDRKPPAAAIACAAELGYEIASHQSLMLDDQLIADGTLIFALDLENFAYLRATYPEARARTFLLGACGASGDGSCEIFDPFGGSDTVFRACFARIHAAVEDLAKQMGRGLTAVQPASELNSARMENDLTGFKARGEVATDALSARHSAR